MTNLLIILAFIAFAIYKQAAKTPKKQQSQRKKPVSPFPQEEETPTEKTEPPASVPETISIPMSADKPRRPAPKPAKPQPAAPAVSTHRNTQTDIRLRTPSDARRAFIYSEIFKRKY